ncbi:MAG: hypothetical protein SF051_15380 [Elusimicrobiota bacterium]|nr:hypothetical protein [Elusimicrobiota bacterium]
MAKDAASLESLKALLAGPDPFEILAGYGQAVPGPWRDWPPERWFVTLRCMLQMTQDQIARKSGLNQSVVSRLEGGFDARLSSWRKAYAAMGFDLVLLPVALSSRESLEARAEEGRATVRWWRQHARPRRRRMRALKADAVKEEAPGA